MEKKGKKAQGVFGMSFGVIFSILLIVFFIIIAFIVIRSFLNSRDCVKMGLFIEGLEKDVNSAWNSDKFTDEIEYALPSNLDYVCFANLSKPFKGGELERNIYNDIGVYQHAGANLFFYPRESSCDIPYYNLKHIYTNKITGLRNPYCLEIEGGKFVIEINKEIREDLVGLK